MLFSFLSSLLIQSAVAVPIQVNQQGRLLDVDGEGLTGANQMVFMLFDSEENGNIYWSETLTVNFTNGYYSTLLGTDEENNPLDESVFAQYPLFMEIKINGEILSPRHPLTSVPYAQIAGVAESVDGGTVNATDVSINSNQVIDGSGNWVGQPITVDWNNIDQTTIPSYITDGDDNTQLSETEVEIFITNGAIDLAPNSQVGGSEIVTVGTFVSNLPSDLADGDDDTLAGVNCAVGELIAWDGNTWSCVSDNTLSVSDVTSMLVNNAVDLNANTTIGGNTIVTSITDADTLAALGCNDGEVVKFNLSNNQWECGTDLDTDTTLDQTGVLNFVAGQQINLGAGSQVDGNNILTTADAVASDWNTLANRPSDLMDGDDDTLAGLGCSVGEIAGYDGFGWTCVSDNTLSVSDVTTMLANNAVDLNVATTIGGSAILTTVTDSDTLAALGCADGEIAKYNSSNGAWACGADIDTDTNLDEATVETYITNGGLDLHVNTTVGGANVVTSVDDSDTLANLSCANDGEIARYDLLLDEWFCDVDIDTVLDEGTVETYVTNGAIDLHQDTTINGLPLTSGAGTVNSSGLLTLQSQGTYSVVTSQSYPSAFMQVMMEVDSTWKPVNIGDTCTNCGDGSDGVFTVSSGGTTTLVSGTYNFSSFDLPSGELLTVTGTSPLIIKSQTSINIEGTITISGGSGINTSGGTGVSGGLNGSNGTYASSSTQMRNGSGGNKAPDWYLCSNTDMNIAGGGGGVGGQAVNYGGGGGAGGGAIVLVSKNIDISGTVNARGGNGAFYDAHSWNGGEWGGGGAGGSIWLSGTGVNVTGTLNVSGGTGGGSGQTGTVRIDAISNEGQVSSTCAFDDLPSSYKNGFAGILEATFSNGILSVQNNSSVPVNSVVNVFE